MLRDVLTIGDKIDIKRLDLNGKPAGNAKTYVSQLIDFINLDVIYIATPIVNSALIILNTGENYNLCFYTKKGLYQCRCVVLNNVRENKTVIAVVRITSNLEKVQRRQYYRLECIQDIFYRVISDEAELTEEKLKNKAIVNMAEKIELENKLEKLKGNWISASMIDISGGGLRFNSVEPLSQGDKVQIKLNLNVGSSEKEMLLGAYVISTGRLINRFGVFEHRVEFNDINKREREELVKYIFEQERRRRKYNS